MKQQNKLNTLITSIMLICQICSRVNETAIQVTDTNYNLLIEAHKIILIYIFMKNLITDSELSHNAT